MPRKNLIGEHFGNLIVLSIDSDRMSKRELNDKRLYWLCECQCIKHTKISVSTSDLTRGRKTHCEYCPNQKIKDLRNSKFGWLTPLFLDRDRKQKGQHRTYWMCQCDCGNQCSIEAHQLISGKTRSCGCYNEKFNDLTNKKFGKLKVISLDKELSKIKKHSCWKCVCECGTQKTIDQQSLLKGSTQSCGCAITSHGENKIRENLQLLNYTFIEQYPITIDNKTLRFDFLILDDNNNPLIFIEYQGKQHYESIDYFGGVTKYIQQCKNDQIKRDYCEKNNLRLLEIPYYNYKLLNEQYLKALIEADVKAH